MEYKYQDSLNILFVAPLKNNAAGIKKFTFTASIENSLF